jgi:hypothetical protein
MIFKVTPPYAYRAEILELYKSYKCKYTLDVVGYDAQVTYNYRV